MNRLRVNAFVRLLASKVPLASQSRNTYIHKRRLPVPPKYQRATWISPYVVGDFIKDVNEHPEYPETYNLYDHDEIRQTDEEPKPPVKVILLENIDGLGGVGDVIDCQADIARFNVILSRKGVYACDFNLKWYKSLIEGSRSDLKPSSILAPFTRRKLRKSVFPIFMHDVNAWTIGRKHILTAFRQNDLFVDPEAIEMPTKEISGPDMEKQYKTFIVHLTINGKERVPTKCMILHLNKALKAEYYAGQLEPLFEEDRQLLQSLPVIEQTVKEQDNLVFD